MAGHPGGLAMVAAGSGLQCRHQRFESLAGASRAEPRHAGDRAVSQPQPARLAASDVDGGKEDGGSRKAQKPPSPGAYRPGWPVRTWK